jgi:hypothetical protein
MLVLPLSNFPKENLILLQLKFLLKAYSPSTPLHCHRALTSSAGAYHYADMVNLGVNMNLPGVLLLLFGC